MTEQELTSIVDAAMGQMNSNDTNNTSETVEQQSTIDKIVNQNFDAYNIDQTNQRFKDADWFHYATQRLSVFVLGAGGIGSNVIYLLSKIAPKSLSICDFDTVEELNMAGQMYRVNDIGLNKVGAIINTVTEFTHNSNIGYYNNRFNEVSHIVKDEVLIGGLDNMDARRELFEHFIKNDQCKLLIDGRLSAEAYQVFCIHKGDNKAIEEYKKKWLFSDSEGINAPCSYKQTAYAAFGIASTIVNILVNYCRNQEFKEKYGYELPLPFATYFDCVTFDRNIEYLTGVDDNNSH